LKIHYNADNLDESFYKKSLVRFLRRPVKNNLTTNHMRKAFSFCLLTILLFCAARTFGQASTISNDSLFSKVLNEQRDFWIKLPENYNPKAKYKYPVVYLLDGKSLQNSLVTVYDNYWGHYLPNMILVGVSNRKNRTRDLTISKISNRNGAVFNQESGGAKNFTDFLESELIPYIEQQYAASNYRTLIGHSYGGLFTINTLIHYKHLFTNYIAIDPSLDWDNQKLLNEAKLILKEEDFSDKSLYISLAAEQLHMFDGSVTIENIMKDNSEFTLFARSIVEFSEYVQSQNELNIVYKVYPEDLHGTVPLPSIRDGLVSLFDWFQFKDPTKYNNPDTTIDELEELLKIQEEIYSKHFGEPTPPMIEELFNGYGYMNLQMGQPDKSKFFFKKQITFYPNSPGGFEGLARYYESKGDYSNAINTMTQAYKLSRTDYHKEELSKLKMKQ
jgi:predicted alpha/beta superfamily hydrolase